MCCIFHLGIILYWTCSLEHIIFIPKSKKSIFFIILYYTRVCKSRTNHIVIKNKDNSIMTDLEKWYSEFQTIVPAPEQHTTQSEATFYCLQGVSYLIDKMVNVGFKNLLEVRQNDNDEQEKESCWCDVNELCRRHPELRKSNVVSRQWRLDNGFPSKGGYKCRQMYYEPDVIEWINRHLRGQKC